ncbi:MAG: hypothetical protein IJ418_09090 [Clostridia bacterium]|nr:hypothetical protein [Clostridia bacterium]
MKERKRIRIGMMEIMPIFDVPAWEDVEEKFGSLDEALKRLNGKKGWQRATISMTTILCNRALEMTGDKLLDERTVARLMPVKHAMAARTACVMAIADGIRTEHSSEPEENERVDLVLREIEKKAEPEA